MVFLLAALGVAVLLTRIGFAFYAAGLVRAKNSAGTVMRIIADLAICVLAYWAIGAALLWQGHNAWFGLNTSLLFGNTIHFDFIQTFFNLMMLLTASSIVGGAMAERTRFGPLCTVSMVLAALVFPVAGNWVWHGWLSQKGYIDVAGASAFHVSAGVFAVVALMFVGPRSGKFNRDGSSSMIPGHNLPMAALGVLLMLAGWLAYVAGANGIWPDRRTAILVAKLSAPESAPSAAATLNVLNEFKIVLAAPNVLLAASAAVLTSMIVARFRYGKIDIVLALTGLLGGLVAISAGGSEIPSWAAVVVGAVAGIIVPLAIVAIDLRFRLDDPLGVIAVHLIGGVWGTLAAGLFINQPIAMSSSHVNGALVNTPSRLAQIGIQVLGLLAIVLLSILVAGALFMLLRVTVGLKTKEADEFDGLDLTEHDIGAYPDFQQNSIKSYHLRET